MRVLVTGVDGYIGASLAPCLLERGHDVVGLDTGFFADGRLYDGVAQLPRTLSKDIRHTAIEDLKGFDVVVHLAELSNDPLGSLKPEVTYAINHRGSVALAQRCREAGVARFIYASSCSVYGVGSGDFKDEQSETNPQTAYAHCKLLVEADVSCLADDDFSPTFLRNATAYGPSPKMRFDIVLNNLAGLAWTTGQIKLISDGAPWRPLVHVLDICGAIACVLEAPRGTIHNEVLNVGDTQENYTIREIAGIVSEAFPGCELVLGSAADDNRSYRVSFEKLKRRVPQFSCKRTAAEGAKQLRGLFERINLSGEMFRSRAYTRLKQLEYLVRTRQLDEDFFWRGR